MAEILAERTEGVRTAPSRREPGCTPSGARPAAAGGSGALGIGAIRADTRANTPPTNDLQKGDFCLKIYPSGFIIRHAGKLPIEPPEPGERGKIEGFSAKAARRLKEAAMTMEVVDYIPLSFTFTTHAVLTDAKWRAVMKRFRVRVKWNEWAGIWRVELQRRQTPHLHCVLWLPVIHLAQGDWFEVVRKAWLECTGEIADPEAFRNAVMGKVLENAGWIVYLALHDSKHKREQLGWIGKQWGIWNRERFTQRKESPMSRDLTEGQLRVLRRLLNRWEFAKNRARLQLLKSRLVTPRSLQEFKELPAKIAAAKRSLSRKLPKGGFLRCVEGSHLEQLLSAMDDHRVCHHIEASEAAASRPFAGPRLILQKGGSLSVGGVVVHQAPDRYYYPGGLQ